MDQMLVVFITVVEKKNFTRAAEELYMTQPAVSQYIHNLEKSVGTILLERSNKYVRLNKAGEIVYHHAKEIVNLYKNMNSLVDDLLNTPRGNLSIGASYTFGEYVLPHIISSFHKKYPLIKPIIKIDNTKEVIDLVFSKQIDIGIIEGHFENSHLAVNALTKDQMYIVCSASHPLAREKTITATALNNEMWIIRENGSGTRENTEKMFALYKLKPSEFMEFGSTQIIKEAVEAGLGISLLSYWAIRKELSLKRLVILPVEGMPFIRDFSIVKLRTPFHTKATEIFLKELENNDEFYNVSHNLEQ